MSVEVTAICHTAELNVLASGGSDGSISFHSIDSEIHLGSTRMHEFAITAMRILDPFALLSSADSGGILKVWTMRPLPNAFSCIASFSTTSPSSVSTLIWLHRDFRSAHNYSACLLAGDLHGMLHI